MIHVFSITDLFSFSKTKISFPFNIDIAVKNIERDKITGPGIYIMTYRNDIIYLGKFRPQNRGNVVKQRWIHHLATFTGRGSKVGFGSFQKWDKYKDLYKLAFNDKKLDFPIESEYWVKRCKDTGTVTSANRMKFSLDFFNDFNVEADEIEKLDFKFYYIKIPQSKIGEINKIENDLITEINPTGNFQYDCSKDTMKLEQMLYLICSYIN